MGREQGPDNPTLQVSVFDQAAKSFRVAKMREVLNASDQKRATLEQEREKRRGSIAAAFNFLAERAMVLDMIDQAGDYPSGIAEGAQTEGRAILREELDNPNSEVQQGLRMILPPGWGRLLEVAEKHPAPPVEKAEEISPNPLVNRLWADIVEIKHFSTEHTMRFSRALATTLEGRGLTREELLFQAYQPEIEQKKLDLTNIEDKKRFNRSFGALMRRAYDVFGLVHHQVVSSEEIKEVVQKGEKVTIGEKRYKVVPEATISKGNEEIPQDLGKKKRP